MTKLKPCPFCGQVDQLTTGQKYDDNGTLVDVWYMGCGGCGTEGPTADSPDAAVEAWNGRAA